MHTDAFDWGKTRQLSVIQVLLAIFIPSGIAFMGFHVVLPALVANGLPVLSPGLPLQGKYGLLPLIGIALLLNILTEELYFRAWLLPKMSRYGAWSWVLNGVLFALYHTFQLWLLPVLLVASLLFAFICYRSKSIWPALVAHLIGNFLLSILGVLMLIAS